MRLARDGKRIYQPMFLKEIETRPPEGMMKIAFNKLPRAGQRIPEILHLFRFKERSTDHLVRFKELQVSGKMLTADVQTPVTP
jgi:hypothetical protein